MIFIDSHCRMMRLPDGERISTIRLAILTRYRSTTYEPTELFVIHHYRAVQSFACGRGMKFDVEKLQKITEIKTDTEEVRSKKVLNDNSKNNRIPFTPSHDDDRQQDLTLCG